MNTKTGFLRKGRKVCPVQHGASGTTFTVVNECAFTVWPGISGTPGFNSTGFELMQNSSRSFQVTDSWDGYIWGRTNCTFNQFGQGSCVIGDCGSNEIECFGRESTSSVTNIYFSLNEVTGETSYSLIYDVNWELYGDYNEFWMTVETIGGSGDCQIIGCLQWWCSKPNMNDSWCQGADYTITFCPLPDTLSIIKLGSERKSIKYLMSPYGDFTLSFFGANNSYLGIWYTYDYQSTKVWVANPNTPITSTSGAHALSIEPSTGNLIITVEGQTVMNITDVKVGPYTDVSAKLQDTGNFQLINNFDEKVLWQSFDHPVNVLLPDSLIYDVNWELYGDYNEFWMTVETIGGSGDCQIIGCLQWWCSKPNMNDSWCQGADYTITFCPLPDTLSIIKLGSERKSIKYLMSPYGDFTLSFFGANNSYLGIWYTYDYQSTKVWVANPNTPITSTSGAHALSIEPSTGNLIITVEGQTVMNITDVKVGPYTDVSAKLQDTGNFQLINNFDEKVLWQSFDHPVNVLLPGMKLGYDKATGRNLTLTSWLTNEIPHSGAFTLSWEATDEASQRLMIRRRGQPYWTSGNLVNQTFPYLVTTNTAYDRYAYNLTYVYNKEEQYFTYTITIPSIPGNESYNVYDVLTIWILKPEGQITDRTPEFCFGYDSGDGCVKESSLPPCRTKNDKFNKLHGEFAPEMARNDTDENSSLSISDCFSKCWNNCSCVGFESNTNDGTGCVLWTGNLSFVVSPHQNSTSKYVISTQHLPSPSTAEDERRKRDAKFLELTASESFKDVHQLESIGGNGQNLLLFSFASIMTATCDFSVEKKLGQGGFGPVYMGILSDGREIAVKRLSRASGQGLVEFKNELILIAKLQHTNLVRAWELWQQGNALDLEDPSVGSTSDIQQVLRTVHVALLCVQENAMDRPTTSDMISMLLNDTISLPAPNKPAFFLGRAESRSSSNETQPSDCSVNNMTISVAEGR
ncbi:S-domain-1 29 [Artemisia annua]|uniref:S-domain-1 29 n=1 Tax=Artemisia annua TaxID=35608 RepID=A0A2U1P3C5_ARTAN|nr:S-domain-1 29 [Artemisia annua]